MTRARRSYAAGRRASHALALFSLALLAACATVPPAVRDLPVDAQPVELTTTPFYAQEQYQCGPAALLTILEQSGVDASLDTIVRRVYLPGREGSLQAELIAAMRAEGRIPYAVDGRAAALAAELDAGRGVLVLQNLGVSWLPRWHYAVVVGIDGDAGRVVLRSGTERRRLTALDTFLHTWRRSGYWGIVALRPGELPADEDPLRFFEALAAMEETGHMAAARQSWRAAARRWPESRIAWFGLGNSEYELGNFGAAETAYRELLRQDPDLAVARNNLAQSLLRQQRYAEARGEAERALAASAPDTGVRAEIGKTLAEIDALSK